MRITIEPTEDQSHLPFNCRQHACTVLVDGDSDYLGDVLALVKSALKGFGFDEKTLDDHIPEEAGGCDEDKD